MGSFIVRGNGGGLCHFVIVGVGMLIVLIIN